MAFNLKKKEVIGVSVTPNVGIEVAQIDIAERTVIKYAVRDLAYDNNRRNINDLDIFKDTLEELLIDFPKGLDIVLNIPTVVFKVNDYPAALSEEELNVAIEEELSEHRIFKEIDACPSAVLMPNSTIQFNKIAYTAAQKATLIEIVLQVKSLGYNIVGIDTSVNSTLNSLIYGQLVDVSPDSNWVMVQVDDNCCRVIPMLGRYYVDSFEEDIAIGEVLGDAENYDTVVSAISPIIKNFPSQYLVVVSKTNTISAEILAGKLTYGAPIIHYEDNCYAKAPLLNVSPSVAENEAKMISLEVIGAAINVGFEDQLPAHFNLFNEYLGDVYTSEQPPKLRFGSLTFVMSLENMIVVAGVFAAIIIAIMIVAYGLLLANINPKKTQLEDMNKKIEEINKFLKENESISSELFDEGDEIRMGLVHNKNIYSYYTIVGTEIPKKLWLTSLGLGDHVTIEGQADNLESVYAFFRSIKDYDPKSPIKLQKLGLAAKNKIENLNAEGGFDTDSILTSLNADFYQFKISDAPEEKAKSKDDQNNNNKGNSNSAAAKNGLPELEAIE